MFGQLSDARKLCLVDNDLAIDALKYLDVRVTHESQRVGFVVCHDDTERFARLFASILVDFILVNVKLQSVFVIVKLG